MPSLFIAVMVKKINNPKPRIGRVDPFGFKPSKTALKKYPQLLKRQERNLKKGLEGKLSPRAQKYFDYSLEQVEKKRGISRTELPYYETDGQRYRRKLRELDRRIKVGELVIQKPTVRAANIWNTIAVLANALGGVDVVADVLDVPIDNVIQVVQGQNLNQSDRMDLEDSYYSLVTDLSLQDSLGINTDEIDYHATVVRDMEQLISPGEGYERSLYLSHQLRAMVANGRIDLKELAASYMIFANLNTKYVEAIFGWIDEGGDPAEFFASYIAGEKFWDLENSTFWAWFREVFYPDA